MWIGKWIHWFQLVLWRISAILRGWRHPLRKKMWAIIGYLTESVTTPSAFSVWIIIQAERMVLKRPCQIFWTWFHKPVFMRLVHFVHIKILSTDRHNENIHFYYFESILYYLLIKQINIIYQHNFIGYKPLPHDIQLL